MVLASELVRRGQDVINLFANVKERVETSTRGQRPWNLDGLPPGRLYLAGLPAPVPFDPAAEARSVWEITKDSTDVGFLNNFIARYKDTFYAEVARERIDQLRLNSGVAGAVPTAPSLLPNPKLSVTPNQPAGRGALN